MPDPRVRSMTGFARVRKTIAGIDLTISLKSVNHRGLDLHFHMSSDLDPFENAIRNSAKRHITRGHIDVRISLTPAGGPVVLDIDTVRLENYLAAFHRIAQLNGIHELPSLNAALQIPGMLRDSREIQLPQDFETHLIAAADEAFTTLNQFREREGAELARILLDRNNEIQKLTGRMEEIRGGAVAAYQSRLKDRLAELLNGAGIDSQRLAQEAAILADRSDIGEEIARLKIHAAQIQQILQTETEVGKKLDFLLQEMNREANTILSKTSGVGEAGLGITEMALAAKSDVEKIREQALNLE